MTTFEHGKAPAWACATWERTESPSIVRVNGMPSTLRPFMCESDADHVCRALSLAKLAEDWGKAERECDAVASRLEDLFMEHPESIAAGKRVDAARALLLKACAE